MSLHFMNLNSKPLTNHENTLFLYTVNNLMFMVFDN